MNQPGKNDCQIQFPPPADDGLGLPDLQDWVKFYGGYHNIPPAAWARWERLYEAYRDHLGTPVIRV